MGVTKHLWDAGVAGGSIADMTGVVGFCSWDEMDDVAEQPLKERSRLYVGGELR